MLRKLHGAKVKRAVATLLATGMLGVSTAGAQIAMPADEVFFVGPWHTCAMPAFDRFVPGTSGTRVAPRGVTTGAPYSAVRTTTHERTLADGNRIVRTTTSRIARDSEGRTRTEDAVTAFGTGPQATVQTFISINDPVANKQYMLTPETKRASVMDMPTTFGFSASDAGVAYGATPVAGNALVAVGGSGAVVSSTTGRVRRLDPGSSAPTNAIAAAPVANTITAVRMATDFCLPGANGASQPVSLGERTIEGLRATGTRYEYQIPAGAIGNEQPIAVSSEQWFSPELGIVVEHTHRNPLNGDTTLRLTNISRAEPDPSLFRVPADYTVTELPSLVERLEAARPGPSR